MTTGSYIKRLKKQLILKKASKPKGDIMGKGKDAKKSEKKKPLKTAKEKKLAKRMKNCLLYTSDAADE